METVLPGAAVLSKELRSASRRRRYYLLRSAYIVCQVFAWGLVWLPLVRFGTSPSVFTAGMMPQVARSLSVGIAWSQFLLSQMLMVLLLSGTISEEIARGTLGGLLATPLTGLQIALGKLLSRGVHLFLFLGISLPVLAIMRVWGGVPWNYVMATWCVTVTAAWATATLALLMSTWTMRMSRAAGRTFLTLLLFLIVTLVLRTPGIFPVNLENWLHRALPYVNPLAVMSQLTRVLLNPGQPATPWLGNCLVMLALGSLLLVVAVLRIPRVGRLRLQGSMHHSGRAKGKRVTDSVIRPVWEPILVWHTVRHIRRGLGRWRARLELLAGILVLLAAYIIFGIYYDAWTDAVFHTVFILIYTFVGLLRVIVHASRSVAEERERRSWPLLLTSNLTAKAIVWQKVLAALLRSVPAWGLMGLHLLIFIPLGVIHPWVPLFLSPFLLSYVVLLALYGICVSLRCRRSSTAIAIGVTTYLLLSVPLCCPVVGLLPSPLFSVGSLMWAMSGVDNAATGLSDLLQPLDHPLEFLLSLWMLPVKTAIQGCLALGLALLAPRWVRRRVFAEGKG